MLTAIGWTLLFAAATSALGFERTLAVWRSTGSRRQGLWPALAALAMILWFCAAAAWALWLR